jgi:2-hydroxychromene-2-carboxylate isomerase
MTLVVPLALAGGWWIFLIFVVVFLFVIAFGYYTVRGSGISQTPYRRSGGPPESPSEIAHDVTQDVRHWERGTDSGSRRPPPSIQEPIDPAVAEALREWRNAPASEPRLAPDLGPDDHVRGQAGATTAAIYVDLASAPSRNAVRLLNTFAAQRPLRVAVRHLPLADVHALALTAAEALEAAGAQGKFFELLDRLAEASVPDEDALLGTASECVADPERLRQEVGAGRYRARVVEQIRQATASGAKGVPEIYIDHEHYSGALRVDPLAQALNAAASD